MKSKFISEKLDVTKTKTIYVTNNIVVVKTNIQSTLDYKPRYEVLQYVTDEEAYNAYKEMCKNLGEAQYVDKASTYKSDSTSKDWTIGRYEGELGMYRSMIEQLNKLSDGKTTIEEIIKKCIICQNRLVERLKDLGEEQDVIDKYL